VTTSTPQSWKVTLDAPVTLLLVAAAAVLVLVPGSTALLRLDPIGPTALFNPRWYLGVVGHVLAHQNFAHFIGNASLFLLLAPGLERRFGALGFAILLGLLAAVTGVSASVVLFFTQKSLVGASGVVFALIFLHAMVEGRGREVPLTAILLGVLWGSKELLGLFDASNVSNSAHLNGALWGFLFGLAGRKRSPEDPPGSSGGSGLTRPSAGLG
jgi:rhomboid protease GluP